MSSSWESTVQLSKMIVVAQSWPKRVDQGSAVDPLSSLAADDADREDNPVHAAAWTGLSSAVDHLALASHQIQRRSRFRPIGILSATRGAVVGASQAIWVLSGSRESRILRALSVKRDEAFLELGFLTDVHESDALRPIYTQEQVEEQANEINEIRKLVTALDLEISQLGGKSRVSTSSMIEEALAAYVRNADPVDGPIISATLQANWRVGSAAAHSRSWAFRTSGASDSRPAGPEQQVVGVATIAQYFLAAALLSNEAWRLWDQSSGAISRIDDA